MFNAVVAFVYIDCCHYIADVRSRILNRKIIWEQKKCHTSAVTGRMEFDAIAFLILAWQKLECFYGKRSGSTPPANQQLVCLIYCVIVSFVCSHALAVVVTNQYAHYHFTALWTLSGTTQVSWYQKVHFAIFWIFWCIIKITHRHTHQQSICSATQSRLICVPISAIPTMFMLDALPGTTLPIYPGLGQAPNTLACIPGGLVL